MENDLWKRSLFINKDIKFLVSREIIEYDMESAGFNIIKNFKLLPENIIEELEELPKKNRDIRIGIMQKKDKEFSKKLLKGFEACRKKFFEVNNIKETDIMAIRKDAIITTKRYPNQRLNQYINFREKNVYSSFVSLNGIEVFYNNKYIDIKGISDEKIKLHNDYFIQFFKEFFIRLEREITTEPAAKFLKEFSMEYRNLDLPAGFYREFNRESLYRSNTTLSKGYSIGYENIEQKDLKNIDITYNYKSIIVQLISLVI